MKIVGILPAMEQSSPFSSYKNPFYVTAVLLVLIGVSLRVLEMCSHTLWVDEAESSINGLTILEHGLPVSHYLGQPIYENTLTEPDPVNPEYEFRDSSYSTKGLAVYHGWLPFYAIAGAQFLFGIEPDKPPSETARPLHDRDDIFYRTIVPRLPAILFSVFYLIVVFILVKEIAGGPAALTSLAWLALGARGIQFGHQARYYSLTLLMSVVCALVAWRLYRRGRVIDYVFLGLAEALLFHSHQLSAVIFALACLALIPGILSQPNWLPKSLLAGGIAAALTVPWAIFSGFFTTASDVPKAYELFRSLEDWGRYFIERPKTLLILGILIAMLPIAQLAIRRGWKKTTPNSKKVFLAGIFLLGWIASAFVLFHILVPAASFFFERITLIALTPIGLFIGVALSEFYPQKNVRLQILASIVAPLVILFLTNHLPRKTLPYENSENKVAGVIDFLNEKSIAVPFRIYSTPNNHLIWTYYTGLPVQSIAPVDRSFLETFPGTIVYLENANRMASPQAKEIQAIAEKSGKVLSDIQIRAKMRAITTQQISQDLKNRELGNFQSQDSGVPKYLQSYLHELEDTHRLRTTTLIRNTKRLPIFKDVEATNIGDLWMSFYYRFSDYPNRIGEKMNILPVLKQSEMIIIPDSGFIAFVRDPLAD